MKNNIEEIAKTLNPSLNYLYSHSSVDGCEDYYNIIDPDGKILWVETVDAK
jgi:hypothetical protein